MQPRKPTQLSGPIADEFGFSEMPKKSAAASGFGRGYIIGFFTSFDLIVASFAAFFFAKSNLGQASAIGFLLFTFGAGFTFAIVYTIVTNKGIPWSVNWFGRVQTGSWDRGTNAFRFWGVCAIWLLISSLLIGGGVWVFVHAVDVGALLGHPPPRHD